MNQQKKKPVLSGLGLHLVERDRKLVIAKVFSGSPAEAAKLGPDSIITGIDGGRIEEADLRKLSRKLMGPEGSKVTIEVQDSYDQVSVVPMIRAPFRSFLPRLASAGVFQDDDGGDDETSCADTIVVDCGCSPECEDTYCNAICVFYFTNDEGDCEYMCEPCICGAYA